MTEDDCLGKAFHIRDGCLWALGAVQCLCRLRRGHCLFVSI